MDFIRDLVSLHHSSMLLYFVFLYIFTNLKKSFITHLVHFCQVFLILADLSDTLSFEFAILTLLFLIGPPDLSNFVHFGNVIGMLRKLRIRPS